MYIDQIICLPNAVSHDLMHLLLFNYSQSTKQNIPDHPFQHICTWLNIIYLYCARSTVFCIEDHYLDLYLGCWCWQSSNYWWLLCRHQPKSPGHRHCNHHWLQNVNNPHRCPFCHHDHPAKICTKVHSYSVIFLSLLLIYRRNWAMACGQIGFIGIPIHASWSGSDAESLC